MPLALALVVGPGCLGQIGATKPETGSCGGAPQIGATPLRRLTRFEYNATVHDLLGDTTHPADAFPTDEIRAGFDNNSGVLGVSPVQAEAYMNAAESLATTALKTPATMLSCDPAKLTSAADEDACAAQFIASFGKRAFRRPPSDDDSARLMSVFHAGRAAQDFTTGIRYAMETILQSPQFLYRVELALGPGDGMVDVAPLDSYEMATRLSYLLWSTMPDAALMAAADAGELTTSDQIKAQVMRMLADPRAHAAVSHFNTQWLKLAKMTTMQKDPKAFPSFDPSLVPLMQQEVQQFLEEIMWGQKGDLHELLTAPYTFVNGPLAQFYGVGGASGSDFVRVDLDPTERAGFLTLGGVMSMLGKADQSSPVQRGKFVREQLLCGVMPNPPPNVPKLPDLSPTLTTRERLSQHSTDPACHSCHRLMDPIGFGFEKYDGAGLFRTTENGKPIDDSGEVQDSDITGTFNGPAELGEKLSQSLFVQKCVVTSWFHYAYARLEAPEDQCTIKTLAQRFSGSGYRFQDLIVALTETDAFRYRRVAGGGQ
ncbi:MAG: DUF1592 domain-containing protein [Polyangia bacterium]